MMMNLKLFALLFTILISQASIGQEMASSNSSQNQKKYSLALRAGVGIGSMNYVIKTPKPAFGVIGIELMRGKWSMDFNYSQIKNSQPRIFGPEVEDSKLSTTEYERNRKLDFLLKYNFLKPNYASKFNVIAGIGRSYLDFSYIPNFNYDSTRFVYIKNETKESKLWNIPVGISYEYSFKNRLSIGAMLLYRFYMGLEEVKEYESDNSSQNTITLGKSNTYSSIIYLKYRF